MEKHNTMEMVRDKEGSCLILGTETDKKVMEIDTFLVWKEGMYKEGVKKSVLEWTEAKNEILISTTECLAKYFP